MYSQDVKSENFPLPPLMHYIKWFLKKKILYVKMQGNNSHLPQQLQIKKKKSNPFLYKHF